MAEQKSFSNRNLCSSSKTGESTVSMDLAYIQSPIHPGYWNGSFYHVDLQFSLGIGTTILSKAQNTSRQDTTSRKQQAHAHTVTHIMSNNNCQLDQCLDTVTYNYFTLLSKKHRPTNFSSFRREYQQRMSIPAYPYSPAPGPVSIWNADESRLPTLMSSPPTNPVVTAQEDPAVTAVPMNPTVAAYPSSSVVSDFI